MESNKKPSDDLSSAASFILGLMIGLFGFCLFISCGFTLEEIGNPSELQQLLLGVFMGIPGMILMGVGFYTMFFNIPT